MRDGSERDAAPAGLDDACDATGLKPEEKRERGTAPKSPKRLADAG